MTMPVLQTISRLLRQHQDKLWWFHSLYSLALGVGIMWLGARHFTYLRVAIFHIAFIWLSSLLLPTIRNHARLNAAWKNRLRLLINYFQRNFYQQLLFFVLPIYYLSASRWSWNMVFIVLLGISALLATMDLIYDRHLSLRWSVMAVFFAFNLFVCINVMLPIVAKIPNGDSLHLSALLALVGFASFCWRVSNLDRRRKLLLILAATLLLAVISGPGSVLIPPAPLRLMETHFFTTFDAAALSGEPLSRLPQGWQGKIFGLTAIQAPLGLSDRVQHRWFVNGRLAYATPFFFINGGRSGGFRLWTFVTLKKIPPHSRLRLDVCTERGQLIGRAVIKTAAD